MKFVVIKRRVIVSVVLLVAVIILVTSNTFWRWMYPIGYQSLIQQSAHVNQLDPLLVASVIRVESQFHQKDVSHAGAIGLMQLMPDTAQWVADQMTEEGTKLVGERAGQTNTGDLASPQLNIQLGSWYIRYLMQQFNGNEVAAIAAYNGGPKRVHEWLATGTWNGQLQTISAIPVGETRHFVDRVFYNYDLYKRIYGTSVEWKRA
ncbi:lytic transglycosylase domain-containing protein [Alicyclobacillus mengziensis]|nr:lytic transglycosylase domain-containing protein [Alicyclobacillus mengziensis]